jgi:hypothetical protein
MKYNIEGGFNFYDELFNTLDKDDDDDNAICLITSLPLENEHITLECNHKFNYLPLIREMYKQKFEYRTYDKVHLKGAMLDKFLNSGKDYYIRCPYCRNIQFEILPYREDKEKRKFYGINTLDTLFRQNMDLINGNKYYTGANSFYHKGIHYKYTNPSNCEFTGCKTHYCALNQEFNVNYCYSHMGKEIRKKISEKKKIQKLEAKEKAKQEKLEAKEKAKQEKLEAKEKVKQEKLEAKEKVKQEKLELKKGKSLNSVISISNDISEYTPPVDEQIFYCEEILKTGVNKGKVCGVKSLNPSISNLCKRHSKKVDKNEESVVSNNVNK